MKLLHTLFFTYQGILVPVVNLSISLIMCHYVTRKIDTYSLYVLSSNIMLIFISTMYKSKHTAKGEK